MGKVAFVFPGQGSQTIGMGKEFIENISIAQELFEKADEVLGFSLTQLCLEGPEEDLKKTYNTQPALLTASIAALYAMEAMGLHVKPDYVAGHSLGEYSALVAAKGLKFEDAVQLVRKRGQAMEEAVPQGQGAMSAIMGMDRELLHQICEEVSNDGHFVQLANINCPGQIVISGHVDAVQEAGEKAKAQGARKVIPLVVSGPFHSKLMVPAQLKLKEEIAQLTVEDLQTPLVANVTANAVTKSEQVRELLVEQVTSSVLWEDSILYLIQQGVDTFIEIGPGKVLSGLIKKIDRSVQVFNIEDMASLQVTKQGLGL
ncbi:[acyl-carrier-protein] S-malonyltransferase [Desulfuribacillus stibiiarsenatis]|uniref:Malonyl CoA-acyl carrier protein transacylase n=1 Tax=Desulfuribacillus stibiiarsenatis TaxID=1390249 RepID=A0A1E5L6U7_9FIRM|nr:ACP S-malonyltransferase [Desulfuribacillus stibiiarsenatis]OEH85778.1 [acyl-carrier-protein] S-malonyltransferase [Desulfuribacillus stibiiarsenatis]